jgi:hypothetical protein
MSPIVPRIATSGVSNSETFSRYTGADVVVVGKLLFDDGVIIRMPPARCRAAGRQSCGRAASLCTR